MKTQCPIKWVLDKRDIIPNLWEAGNRAGAIYFVSILSKEIGKAEVV